MAQIPHGPADRSCPLWRKPMSKVCHTCPLWVQIRGRNPNTGQDVDEWNCSLAWMPVLLIENAQRTREVGGAVESFRNESLKQGWQAAQVLVQGVQAVQEPKRLEAK